MAYAPIINIGGQDYKVKDSECRNKLAQTKKALMDTVFNHAEIISATWEQGSIDAHGVNVNVNNRIRFVGKLKIEEGCTIFAIADDGYEVEFYLYDSTQTFKSCRDWMEYDSLKYGQDEDEAMYYRMIARHTDNSNIAVSEKDHITFVSIKNEDYISFIDNMYATQNVVIDEVGLPYSGYLNDDGTVHAQTYEIEKYSDHVKLSKGKKLIQYDVDFPTGKAPWIRLNFFNSSDEAISCMTFARENKQNTIEIDVTDANIDYMIVSCRTFNVDCHVSVSERFINFLNDKIEESKQDNFNKSNSTVFVSREGKFSNTIENSEAGIRAAKANGYDTIRVSVQFSSDGVPVLFHDERIGVNLPVYDENDQLITNGDKISAYTYETLVSYHYGSTTNQLVTLERCAELCKKYGLGLVLEVKEATIPTEQNMSNAYDIVAKHGMIPVTEWDIYTSQTANYILDIDETADIGFISETISTSTIDEAAALKTGKNKVYFCAYASKFSSFTDALHIYGIRNGVMFKMGSAYSVAEINTYRNFEKIEVQGVINPAKAYAIYN